PPRARHVEDPSVSHFNLSILLRNSNTAPELILAHRLAAVIVDFQTHSGRLEADLASLRQDLSRVGWAAALPASFEELCERVERVPGVRFRELYERLPQRVPDGDQALAQV